MKDVGTSQDLAKEWKLGKITSTPTRVVVAFL